MAGSSPALSSSWGLKHSHFRSVSRAVLLKSTHNSVFNNQPVSPSSPLTLPLLSPLLFSSPTLPGGNSLKQYCKLLSSFVPFPNRWGLVGAFSVASAIWKDLSEPRLHRARDYLVVWMVCKVPTQSPPRPALLMADERELLPKP